MAQILIPKKPETEALLETIAEDMRYETGCSADPEKCRFWGKYW